PAPLREATYEYDGMNRVVRADNAWRDPLTGEALGSSGWDGREGVVSRMLQYDANSKPSRLWTEGGRTLRLDWDGADRIAAISDGSGDRAIVAYDGNSNPVRLERTAGGQRLVVEQNFDDLDRLLRRRRGGAEETFRYNALGRLLEHTSGDGSRIRYMQDHFGRPAGHVRSATEGGPTSVLGQRLEWDAAGRLTARVDALGHTVRCAYNARDELVGVVEPDGSATTLSRDANGNVVQITRPDGTVVSDVVDARGRVVQRSVGMAGAALRPVAAFGYDGANRVLTAETDGAVIHRRYDTRSLLVEETSSGRTVRYGHDGAGNVTALSYPGGQRVARRYDSASRLVEVTEAGNPVAAYEHGFAGRVTQRRLGDRLVGHITYEPGTGLLAGVEYRDQPTGALVDGYRYAYDKAGRRTAERQLRSGDAAGERYAYDTAGRLVGAEYGVADLDDPSGVAAWEDRYELGPTGLWEATVRRDGAGAARTQAVANARGTYVSVGAVRYEYDPNGNRVSEEAGGSAKRYAYDAEGRVTQLELPGAPGAVAQTVSYAYDAFGRQFRRRTDSGGQTREVVRVWGGTQLLEEWEDGRLSRSFVHGLAERDPLRMRTHAGDATRDFYYAVNGRDLITALVDAQGEVAESYAYNVYGRLGLGAAGGNGVSAVGNPLLGMGALWDAGAGLYFTRGIAYDARSGLLLSPRQPQPLPPAVDYHKVWDDMADVGELLILLGIVGEVIGVPGSGVVVGFGGLLALPHQIDKLGQKAGWWSPGSLKGPKGTPGTHGSGGHGASGDGGSGYGASEGAGYGGGSRGSAGGPPGS
ncbi:MAG: hypothetical protein WCG47_08340, partial [Dermatophilaceae bacterium]